MPLLDGYQAVHEVRKVNKDIPVIALTAHAFSEEKARCTECGCNDFLPKPITGGKLISMLSHYLT